jgi:DNA-binding MarR family transcriptional regulator
MPRQPRSAKRSASSSVEDIALERALEGMFRLRANRRFDARQTARVGAVVTRAGYALLRSLSDNAQLSLRELADSTHMDAATASRQVNQLVEERLVHRRPAVDARAVVLSLTSHGEEVYERIVAYRLEHLANVLTSWSDHDRGTLAVLVNRLSADLSATDDGPS